MPKRVEDQHRSVNPPLYGSTAFAFNSVEEGEDAFGNYGYGLFAYGRMGNPSVTPFEEWFADFEGTTRGSVWATGAGMSATNLAVDAMTSCDYGKGKHVVAPRYLYGGTYHRLEYLCRNGNITLSWVEDPFDVASWEKAICENDDPPALVFLETPSNPNVDLFDISEIASVVHAYGSRLIVDNTIGVGLTTPLTIGADGVVYSVTKALNRQSSELGGAFVVTPNLRKEIEGVADDLFVHCGVIISPQSALAAFSNRTTLERDMKLFSENALCVASFLEGHSKVAKVNYPFLPSSAHLSLAERQMPHGGGGLLSFELRSYDDAVSFVEEQEAAFLAVHLGDGNHEFVTHPASTTHSKLSEKELRALGVTPGLVRMSVSLKNRESFDGVISEYERALDSLDS